MHYIKYNNVHNLKENVERKVVIYNNNVAFDNHNIYGRNYVIPTRRRGIGFNELVGIINRMTDILGNLTIQCIVSMLINQVTIYTA